jgi:GH43 family beta-xylosidase
MNSSPKPTCRLKTACFLPLGLLLVATAFARAGDVSTAGAINRETFVNPIYEQADPWITQEGGHYLACFAEGNRGISVQISDRLTVPGPKHIVWKAPETGPASREVWAPELHLLDGHWYVYFAADDGQNRDHQAWVLQSDDDDPSGPYTLQGPLYTGDDPAMAGSNSWAIDMTVFQLDRRLYAIWSGWQDDRDLQYLYIAPMRDPVNMAASRVRICANDDYLWERVNESVEGRGLNEAPEVLQHDGRTFLAYSCSGSWQPSYKIGMLELRPGGDPLRPADWKKFPAPIFQSSATTFGVGHNSFVKSPDGTQDWLVYHAKWSRSDGWQRTVFTQPFHWHSDGTPDLGVPVAYGQPLPLPAGEKVPLVKGQRDFSFDNTDSLAGWAYYGHHQMIWLQDGWLHLGGLRGPGANDFRTGEKVIVDGGDWTDFVASVQIRPLDHAGDAGILFRVQQPAVGYNAQCGYYAGVATATSRVVLGFTDGKSWHELASAPLPGPLPNIVTLAVEADANHLLVRLQDKVLIETSDPTYLSGSVGLRVVNSHTAFYNLHIKPLDLRGASAEKASSTFLKGN